MPCFKSIFSSKFNPKDSVCQGTLHSPTGPPFLAQSVMHHCPPCLRTWRSVPLSLPLHSQTFAGQPIASSLVFISSSLLCPHDYSVLLWVLTAASSLGCFLSPVSLSRSVQVHVPVEALIKSLPAGNLVPHDYRLKSDTSIHFLPNGYK